MCRSKAELTLPSHVYERLKAFPPESFSSRTAAGLNRCTFAALADPTFQEDVKFYECFLNTFGAVFCSLNCFECDEAFYGGTFFLLVQKPRLFCSKTIWPLANLLLYQ